MVPPRNHEILNQFLSSGSSFISTSFLWYSVRSLLLSQMSLGFSLLLLNQRSETERFLLLPLENHYKRNVHEADKNVIAFSGRQHWHGLCYTQYFFRRHPKPSVYTAGLMSLQKTQCSIDRLGIFWVGMYCPGLQIGTLFQKKFPLKLIPLSRNGPIFYTPFQGATRVQQFAC